MSDIIPPPPGRHTSPKALARLIGVLTILTVIGGVYALGYVSEKLVVWRDPAATAANILGHRNLYLSGVAVYLVEMALSVASTALLYVLLKPAGRSIALVMLSLGLIANTIKLGGRVLFAAPLYLVGSTRFHTLGPEALNDLSLILLLVNDHAAGIAMGFFGFQSLLAGWLKLRSTFLPKVLGVLSIIGGLAWLTHLWPPLGYKLGQNGLLIGVVGVFAEIVWFLVVGVNEARWHEQARANQGAI